MSTTTHSWKHITTLAGGKPLFGLEKSDDCVVVARGSDLSKTDVGVDGSYINSVTADESARITIKCLQNSAAQNFFASKAAQTRETGGLRGKFTFAINDRSNSEGGSSNDVIIEKEPDLSKGENATTRTWVLFAGQWSENIPNT